mgnify:CR=1 FL=1
MLFPIQRSVLGWPGHRVEALIRGQRVKVMSVTLEHTTLDLTGIDSPRLGEEVLLLGGAPIREPVVQYGPFVMNTRAQILEAVDAKCERWP